jgi:magnesium-transporting ATPase (P-type)
MSIFSKKPEKVLTEEDYKKAANEANQYAVAGFIIPIVSLLAIWEIPRCLKIARNSQDPKVLKKIKHVSNNATALFFWEVVWIPVFLFLVLNLPVGIILVLVSVICTYFYGKKHMWSNKKIIIYILLTMLVSIYGVYSYFYNKDHSAIPSMSSIDISSQIS